MLRLNLKVKFKLFRFSLLCLFIDWLIYVNDLLKLNVRISVQNHWIVDFILQLLSVINS